MNAPRTPTQVELERWGDCPGARTVIEIDVADLLQLGATDRELVALGVDRSAQVVRLWWFFVGPSICIQHPRLAASMSRLGLVPRIVGSLLPRHASGAYLEAAYLVGAQLSGGDLSRANLRGANLRSACLAGANLSGCQADGASFLDADLSRANFRDASLRGADLTATELHTESFAGADLEGARWPVKPTPDGWELWGDVLVRARTAQDMPEGPEWLARRMASAHTLHAQLIDASMKLATLTENFGKVIQ